MELRYRREAAVGLLLIVATALFVFGLIWLRGRSLKSGEFVRASFGDVTGLKVGDPVRTAGVFVGQVNDIELGPKNRVILTLKLIVHRPPHRDAVAVIRAQDMFGAEYVDYQPGSDSTAVAAADTIPGERQADLNQLAQSFSGPGRQALTNAAQFLSPQNSAELRGLLVDARAAVSQLGSAAEGPSREATRAMGSLRDVLARLDAILSGDTTAQTLDNVRVATRNLAQASATLQRTTATLDSILVKINSNRGSLGRMVNDTTLVTDLHNASTALTDLLTDLKANPSKYIHVRVF